MNLKVSSRISPHHRSNLLADVDRTFSKRYRLRLRGSGYRRKALHIRQHTSCIPTRAKWRKSGSVSWLRQCQKLKRKRMFQWKALARPYKFLCRLLHFILLLLQNLGRTLHMWVEFVVGSRPCSEGFSPGTPVFLPPQKSTFSNSNSTWKQWMEEPLRGFH